MSINRYDARRDENEQPIVQALRGAGCVVFLLNEPFDLLVGSPSTNQWHLIEVKMPKGKLNVKQRQVMHYCEQYPTSIVRTPKEALIACGFTGAVVG